MANSNGNTKGARKATKAVESTLGLAVALSPWREGVERGIKSTNKLRKSLGLLPVGAEHRISESNIDRLRKDWLSNRKGYLRDLDDEVVEFSKQARDKKLTAKDRERAKRSRDQARASIERVKAAPPVYMFCPDHIHDWGESSLFKVAPKCQSCGKPLVQIDLAPLGPRKLTADQIRLAKKYHLLGF